MAQGDNWRKNGTPTMQMLKCLMELEERDAKRGSTVAIASICGIHHGSVSRYFKICREKGILTDNLEFTGKGKAWFKGYQRLIEEYSLFMRRAGISPDEIPEKVRNLIENLDYYTLACMARWIRGNLCLYSDRMRDKPVSPLYEMLDYGKWEVSFALFFIGESGCRRSEKAGLKNKAVLIHNRRGGWLELELEELKICSRMNHKEITGCFDSVKYFSQGIFHSAQKKISKIRIPLAVCSTYRMQGGEITAHVFLSLCFNKGRVHMAERLARLVFWI